MDMPRRGNTQTNRLHRDKPEIHKLCTENTRETRLGRERGKQRQRAVITMEIRIRLAKHYFYKIPPGTGTETDYNIKRAKKRPDLLGK